MGTTTHEETLFRAAERRRLVRLCALISGDDDAAEDLAQETLLEAWRNAHKLTDPSGAERWLAAVARNVCLRWRRSRGREAAARPDAAEIDVDAVAELDRADRAQLVDRALALLPGPARQVLVDRYMHELPQAEIAARLGISEDAASMRLSRAKSALRRLLETELREEAEAYDLVAGEGGWQPTRVWCFTCGRRRLEMHLSPATLVVRCLGCHPDGVPATVLDLENEFFARLVGDLVRPAAIIRRVIDWSARYFASERDTVDCTRCGHTVTLRTYERAEAMNAIHRRGLFVRCDACGEEATASVASLALAQPAVRRFRREHPRTEALPVREVDARMVVGYRDVRGRATVDVLLRRDSLRVLDVVTA